MSGSEVTEARPAERPPPTLRKRLAGLAPWVVTLAALGWIGVTTDWDRLIAAALQANWLLFWATMLVLYGALFIVDSFAIMWVYRRYNVPDIRFADVLPGRGVTYILGIINYGAGTAAMALYFKKRFGVGLVEGGASLMLLMLVDLGLLVLAILLGSALLPGEWQIIALRVGAVFVIGAAAHLLFWRAPWTWGPLERIRSIQSLRGFREASLEDYAKMAVLRAPVVVLYIGMHVLTLLAFDVWIPMARMLVYVPLLMMIAVIPVSVSGFGTVQLAQRELYGPFAPNLEVIDAYGLALILGFIVPRVIIGIGSLHYVRKALASVGDPGAPRE